MKQTITALCEFFDREIPRLSDTYSWKIPDIQGFAQAGFKGYEPNIALKVYLKELWDNAFSNAEKLKVAKVIVSDWGGVRANSEATLSRYVLEAEKSNPSTPVSGVASYSKILSIVHPERFAIYDARVAACINAVQINAGEIKGIAFNYVPGRNNIVGNVVTRKGFTQDPRFSTKRLVELGWSPVKRSDTYLKYLELLYSCLEKRAIYTLASLEMALFANAEYECKKAMGSVLANADIF